MQSTERTCTYLPFYSDYVQHLPFNLYRSDLNWRFRVLMNLARCRHLYSMISLGSVLSLMSFSFGDTGEREV